MEIFIENPDMNNIDEVFYAYIILQKKQKDFYLFKCHFRSVFNENQYSEYVKSNLFFNGTMISWQKFLEKMIDDFKNKGNNFNHIEDMNIITIVNKRYISSDFYIKQKMCA